MNKQIDIKPQISFIDSIKKKIYESATDYFKSQFEKSKKELFNHFEKKIEKKIKKELRKMGLKFSSLVILSLGFLILLYGTFAAIVYLSDLPTFLAPIFYGLFLMIVGLFVYVLNN